MGFLDGQLPYPRPPPGRLSSYGQLQLGRIGWSSRSELALSSDDGDVSFHDARSRSSTVSMLPLCGALPNLPSRSMAAVGSAERGLLLLIDHAGFAMRVVRRTLSSSVPLAPVIQIKYFL